MGFAVGCVWCTDVVWSTLQAQSNAKGIAKGIQATVLPFDDPTLTWTPSWPPFADGGKAGLIVFPTAANNVARKKIVSASARLRLPAIYPFREGGLTACGVAPSQLVQEGRVLCGSYPQGREASRSAGARRSGVETGAISWGADHVRPLSVRNLGVNSEFPISFPDGGCHAKNDFGSNSHFLCANDSDSVDSRAGASRRI
jgi:hypothetical protein